MKYLRRFNESILNVKELEFDEEMMYQTVHILSLLDGDYNNNISKIVSIIKDTLSPEIYNKLFDSYKDSIKKDFDIFNYFTSSVLSLDNMTNMFDNLIIHDGSDGEEEWVSALEINGKIVLLLLSEERGNQVRIQDDRFSIKVDEVASIIKTLCELYNDKLKYYI